MIEITKINFIQNFRKLTLVYEKNKITLYIILLTGTQNVI